MSKVGDVLVPEFYSRVSEWRLTKWVHGASRTALFLPDTKLTCCQAAYSRLESLILEDKYILILKYEYLHTPACR